ncbi:MAG: hypothetical protein ACK5OW_00100 [bacterium]|jgi:hypothetical protein
MQQKTLLLASFLKEDKLDWFLNKIWKNFNVKKQNVFFFKMNDDYVLTYRLSLDIEKRIDIKKELPKTIQIHKKGSTMFTINALNKLIETESGLQGNVNHKDFQVDWSKYENKIILLKGEDLEILPIERIFFNN